MGRGKREYSQPTPSKLLVTDANSAVTGEIIAAEKKSVHDEVSDLDDVRVTVQESRGLLRKANMTMKYARFEWMVITNQKGSAPTRHTAVLTIVPPRSAYHPLRGEATRVEVSYVSVRDEKRRGAYR